MSIKLVDTAVPMNEGGYPVARAKDIWFEDNTNLQDMSDNGSMSGVELLQSEYDSLTDEEKLNGLKYHCTDTGRIYQNGVLYGEKKPIELTYEEYKQLETDGLVESDVDYIIVTNENGILLTSTDVAYDSTKTVKGKFDELDELLADGTNFYSPAPIGTVLSFAGHVAPNGYLLCDGASYKRYDYPDLYAVIGNTYGGDDTNFNVPNLINKFVQGSNTSGTEKEAGLPQVNMTNAREVSAQNTTIKAKEGLLQNGQSGYGASGSKTSLNATSMVGLNLSNNDALSVTVEDALIANNPIYGNSDTVQPPALTMVYIIKAKHTNEGQDEGVSDSVIDYVDGEIAEVETTLPNIKKFANPGGIAKYITISGATLGDIEVHSAYAGKYMFTSTGAEPIFFGTRTYLGYTLTGWAWSSDKTKLYLRVNGQRDFVISAFGSDGVEMSDMTTTAPTDVTFNATFNYNAYIDNSSTSETSTWSSSTIAQQDGVKNVFYATSTSFPAIFTIHSKSTTGVFWFKHTRIDSHGLKSVEGYYDIKNSNIIILNQVGADLELPLRCSVYADETAKEYGVKITAIWQYEEGHVAITEARPVTAIPYKITY